MVYYLSYRGSTLILSSVGAAFQPRLTLLDHSMIAAGTPLPQLINYFNNNKSFCGLYIEVLLRDYLLS